MASAAAQLHVGGLAAVDGDAAYELTEERYKLGLMMLGHRPAIKAETNKPLYIEAQGVKFDVGKEYLEAVDVFRKSNADASLPAHLSSKAAWHTSNVRQEALALQFLPVEKKEVLCSLTELNANADLIRTAASAKQINEGSAHLDGQEALWNQVGEAIVGATKGLRRVLAQVAAKSKQESNTSAATKEKQATLANAAAVKLKADFQALQRLKLSEHYFNVGEMSGAVAAVKTFATEAEYQAEVGTATETLAEPFIIEAWGPGKQAMETATLKKTVEAFSSKFPGRKLKHEASIAPCTSGHGAKDIIGHFDDLVPEALRPDAAQNSVYESKVANPWWFGYCEDMFAMDWDDVDMLGSMRLHHSGTTRVALIKAETLWGNEDFKAKADPKTKSDKSEFAKTARVWLSALAPKDALQLPRSTGVVKAGGLLVTPPGYFAIVAPVVADKQVAGIKKAWLAKVPKHLETMKSEAFSALNQSERATTMTSFLEAEITAS